MSSAGIVKSTYLPKLLPYDEAFVDIEPLRRRDILDSQQEHDLVDVACGRAGVLLAGCRELPDRSVRACTTPPKPHIPFAVGFSTVAPAATAASKSAWTFAGCEAMSEMWKPRNPAVAASDARNRTRGSVPKAVV